MMKPELKDRNGAMAELYATGATLEEVGEAFGRSRETVRHTLIAIGVVIRSVGRRPRTASVRIAVNTLHAQGKTVDEIAAATGVAPSVVRRIMKQPPLPRPPRALGPPIAPRKRRIELTNGPDDRFARLAKGARFRDDPDADQDRADGRLPPRIVERSECGSSLAAFG